ncbi:MAG: DEAD/DEAH box helicase family protein [Proteobacteria bacterium]|nr:DEAD/DEAH box helicase family protein [Pseudomonadota bacterium]
MLRPYQVAAVAAIREQFRAGCRSTLLVQATGTGKTITFSDVARRTVDRGGRVLIVVHRDELIQQADDKLRAAGLTPGIEKAASYAGNASVVIASVQTLRGKRLAAFAFDAFALVIVDEAHHAVAPGYRAILAYFTTARVLGVTATPDRLDGKGIRDRRLSLRSARSHRRWRAVADRRAPRRDRRDRARARAHRGR